MGKNPTATCRLWNGLPLMDINGVAVQFAAKVEIKPEYWNVQAGKAIGRNKVEVQEANNLLESIKATMTYFQPVRL